MQVFYDEEHRRHAPAVAFADGVEKAHPEVPERAENILGALRDEGMEPNPPERYDLAPVLAVHAEDYVEYLAGAWESWASMEKGRHGVIPSTFPRDLSGEPPEHLVGRAGWYCFDTETPIGEHTWQAALQSAWCALTGAGALLAGSEAAYALCRPPGHHAGPACAGGYCYLNNAAVAAEWLREMSARGVAILDLDYHHGNGTQEVFYATDEVLYASIHADPAGAYPYFAGYAGETGSGAGQGFNVNLPLPAGAGEEGWLAALDEALGRIADFGPAYLVVSLGTDPASEDPLGRFELPVDAFGRAGAAAAELDLPTLTVQEGGYDLGSIGRCVAGFLGAWS